MNNYCAIDTEVVETEFIEESLARVSVIDGNKDILLGEYILNTKKKLGVKCTWTSMVQLSEFDGNASFCRFSVELTSEKIFFDLFQKAKFSWK